MHCIRIYVNGCFACVQRCSALMERTAPLPPAPLPWQHSESVGCSVDRLEGKMEENTVRDVETGV